VLTKVTKYSTIIFFGLALVLGYLQNRVHDQGSMVEFEKQVQQKQMQVPVSTTQPVAPPVSQPAAAPTNDLLSLPLSAPTNAPAEPANDSAEPTQSK
jgi:hypothetical protein